MSGSFDELRREFLLRDYFSPSRHLVMSPAVHELVIQLALEEEARQLRAMWFDAHQAALLEAPLTALPHLEPPMPAAPNRAQRRRGLRPGRSRQT